MNIGSVSFLSNSLLQWLVALGIGLLVYILLRLLVWLLRRKFKDALSGQRQDAGVLIKRLLDKTTQLSLAWLALFIFTRFLNLSSVAVTLVDTLTIMVALIQLGLWMVEVIEYWFIHRRVTQGATDSYSSGSFSVVALLTKIVIWSVVVILILENIPGVHVTALIASLGIGGIAIGLALQNVLGDLFASLTISIDRPFVVGDAISVDEFSGQVEHIGLKSTRIRSNSGEQLVFSNTDLVSSRIHNNTRMEHRTVVFTLNISYRVPYKKLHRLPDIIKSIIEAQKQVTFNRSHFKGFAESSLQYETAYTVNTPDFNQFMDVQQKINLEIIRQLEDNGIQFAFPRSEVMLEK